ncbi:MAG TPA: sensor histidine kinase [Epulopiscium sp.]|nr:sensor histidine kinase [Candidatus Epulonipiscium sp.]
MKELSLHILDIVQNSVRAKATEVEVTISEDLIKNRLEIIIKDNGKGMPKDLVEQIKNPFATTRTTRKVGLGIPLLLEASQRCDGDLQIESEEGVGTTIRVEFTHDHIDRAPMGDVVNTITMLILSSSEIRYIFTYSINNKKFTMDTKEVEEILQGVPINDLSVIKWLEDYLKENIAALND